MSGKVTALMLRAVLCGALIGGGAAHAETKLNASS